VARPRLDVTTQAAGETPSPARRRPAPHPPGPLPAGQPREVIVATVGAALAELPPGVAVVVACSGGPDSTALAYLAAEARPDLALVLGHVRHGLRDDAADLAVVQQHAAWLGCALEVRKVDVVASGEGPEGDARAARYAALRAIAAAARARAVLLGHTADDQAETVLLRLARGTGLPGLQAMAGIDGDRWRPLLRLRRADVHAFVAGEGLPVAEDPTNAEVAQPRARARHDVLPALRALGPDPVGALARLADLARTDEAALTGWAHDELRAHGRRVGPVLAITVAALDALPLAVDRRVVRHLVAAVGDGRAPSAATVAAVRALRAGERRDLPGELVAGVGGGWLTVAPAVVESAEAVELPVGGRVEWSPAGITLGAIGSTGGERGTDPAGTVEQTRLVLPGAWVPPAVAPPARLTPPGGDTDRLTLAVPDGLGPLSVRHRRPGDRIRTPAGTKRVAAVLVDLGVPLAVRDRWPVVAAGDRVVWVPGLVADRDVLAAGRADPVALLLVEDGGHRHAPSRRRDALGRYVPSPH
jgi:tRNA(Ile)-lysidine synthase